MILAQDEPLEMVKRSVESVKDYVDGMYIAITYKDEQPSEENELAKLLKELGVNVLYFKWISDFAAARQYVMDNTPHGATSFIYWHDADDILRDAPNLRKVANEAVIYNHAAVFFDYWYRVALDANNNVRDILVEHKRERLIRNDGGFKWIGSLHETLIEQRTENVLKVPRSDCVVVHLTSDDRIDKSLDRNVAILEAQAEKEKHSDPRTLIYLGKAYFDKANMQSDPAQRKIFFDLSTTLLQEYLQGAGTPGTPGYQEGSGWPEERATAWAYIAEVAKINGNFNTAIRCLHNAIIEAPAFPNYYVDIAQIYSMKGDHAKAKHWLQLATNVDMPETTIVTAPRDLKMRALEVDYNVALAEGKFEQAVEDSNKLLEILPDNQELIQRHEVVQNLSLYNKAAQSIVFLGKYLEQIKQTDKIAHLIRSIPQEMMQEQFATEMAHLFLPPKTWESDEIAIVCGPGFEEWSPKSVQTGLGGSEEAVVYMAQELKRKGWKVTVFANPGKDAGDHQGVNYVSWNTFNTKDNFNILILWRNIGLVDHNLQARYKMVWMHDVPTNPDFTQERVGKVDKIAVLSEFHKTLFRMHTITGESVPMPEEKFFVTANGIPTPQLNTKWKRDPKAMIYASSPDRGLVYLLNNWSKILEKCPEAKLDVFYGFQVFDVIHQNNPARMAWKAQVLEMMKQPGITYHGRVGHTELNKQYATHGVWAYPTDFEEISCISAMKAQSCGAIPVTTNYAALKETVRNGYRVDVDIKEKSGQDAYLDKLCEVLNDEKGQEEIRKGMMDFAQKNFSWTGVATEWDELFRKGLNLVTPTGEEESK